MTGSFVFVVGSDFLQLIEGVLLFLKVLSKGYSIAVVKFVCIWHVSTLLEGVAEAPVVGFAAAGGIQSRLLQLSLHWEWFFLL